MGEEQLGGQRVERGAHEAAGDQRLDLGGEGEAVRGVGAVERLDAHAVARQHEAAVGAVPERDREHPAQVAHEVGAVLLVEVHDRLRVALGRERVAARGQVAPQLGEVEDLAVEDGEDAAVLVARPADGCRPRR